MLVLGQGEVSGLGSASHIGVFSRPRFHTETWLSSWFGVETTGLENVPVEGKPPKIHEGQVASSPYISAGQLFCEARGGS